MPYTNCKAHMEFVDVSAIGDSILSSSGIADIGDLELLKENIAVPDYAIPDLNSFVLDGTKRQMPDNVVIPYISNVISGTDCTFAVNPVITVTFEHKHTSAGIMLYFVSDYPAEIKITWYTPAGTKLMTETFYPDGLTYYCQHQEDNYGKITIEFLKTRLPNQRVLCRYIKYGAELEWSGETIQKASIYEEVDLTGATLSINTADLSIVDEANDFDLSNHNGVWKSIQKSQEITLVEELNEKDVICGTMFIDTWKIDSNVVSFSLIDRIGMIDKTKFYGGQIYSGVAAGNIIDNIMQSAGVTNYIVAEDVAGVLLTGYLPICTHREALQQVAFACGAICNCDRTGTIRVYMPDRYADSTIGTDRRFMGTTIELEEYVSGVSVTYKTYLLKDETAEIYHDTLPAGESMIEFAAPYADLTVSAGNIIKSSVNYAIIHMSEEGDCIVTGKKYETREITYTENVSLLDAGEEENIVSYSGCTLINAERAKAITHRLLEYHQLRQSVNMSYLMDAERTGDWVNIKNTSDNLMTTVLTSQSVDLTGGFISQAKARGYSVVTMDNAYTGEIYAGERGVM